MLYIYIYTIVDGRIIGRSSIKTLLTVYNYNMLFMFIIKKLNSQPIVDGGKNNKKVIFLQYCTHYCWNNSSNVHPGLNYKVKVQ
jgi:hypothetical protein